MNTPCPPVSSEENSAAGPAGRDVVLTPAPAELAAGLAASDALRLLLEQAHTASNTMQLAANAGRSASRGMAQF
jgi:hypothetical protein